MSILFTRIYDFFEKRRGSLIILFSSLLLLFAWFASQLKFEEDIAKILPADKKIEKLDEVFQNSKFIDKLVIMVSLKDTNAGAAPDSLVDYSQSFVQEVKEKLQPFIARINDKVDDELALELYGTISDHLPIYLDDKDYSAIDSLITTERIRQTPICPRGSLDRRSRISDLLTVSVNLRVGKIVCAGGVTGIERVTSAV